jgi:hypothetical protein
VKLKSPGALFLSPASDVTSALCLCGFVPFAARNRECSQGVITDYVIVLITP